MSLFTFGRVIKIEKTNDTQKEVLPYLIFKIQNTMYAVNGEMINSIFVLEQPITHVPMSESHVRGIVNVRGEIVPILDMRVLLELPTAEKEYEDFKSMLELRKSEHEEWVEEFDKSLRNDTPFLLETDPHKCAFGKWYDSFSTESSTIEHYMKQIKEPHKKLHECAGEVLNMEHRCEQPEVCQKALKLAEEVYMPATLNLIDKALEVYNENNKQMVIVVQYEDIQMGILVDEVVEVTNIKDIFSLKEMPNSHHSKFVRGVGTVKHFEKEILMLDVKAVSECK